jgi:ABC-type hemin transport system substrate-binding protein
VYELGIALREEHPMYVAFGSPNEQWRVLYALGILLGHYPKLDIHTNSDGDRDIVKRIESSKVDVEMVKQKVKQALIAAARDEVTNKAHVPEKIADEAMNLIREIGWQKVRNSGPEAQRVIGVFQRSLL